MNIEEVAAEALRLPRWERSVLVKFLWDSLVDPCEVRGRVDDSEVALSGAGQDWQFEEDELQAVSQDEMLTRVRLALIFGLGTRSGSGTQG